jgi:hypothetical protein
MLRRRRRLRGRSQSWGNGYGEDLKRQDALSALAMGRAGLRGRAALRYKKLTHGNKGVILFHLVDTSDSLLGMNDLKRILFWFAERLILDHAIISKRFTHC